MNMIVIVHTFQFQKWKLQAWTDILISEKKVLIPAGRIPNHFWSRLWTLQVPLRYVQSEPWTTMMAIGAAVLPGTTTQKSTGA